MTARTPMQEAAAEALWEAERAGAPIEPISQTWPSLTIGDAYAIQQLNIDRKVQDGAVVRGHKVGLSSPAMQEMMGVAEPDFGHLLDTMFEFEEHEIHAASICQPRVEVEVAFLLGTDLPGASCTVADVLLATEMIVPSIEVIGSRIRNWQIGIVDTIADNASSAAVVLGGNGRRIQDLDPRDIDVAVFRNGEKVASGSTSAVLGNPATSVAWLARTLARFDTQLLRGHVVMTGSCTRAIDVAPGDSFEATFDHLGPLRIRFG